MLGRNQQFRRTRSRTGPEAGGHCLRLPKLQEKRKEKFDEKKLTPTNLVRTSFIHHFLTTFLMANMNFFERMSFNTSTVLNKLDNFD